MQYEARHYPAFPTLVSSFDLKDHECEKTVIDMIETFEDPEIKEAVVINYHKVLAYKDEYEVARLHLGTYKKVDEKFENVKKVRFHLAPPLLSKEGKDGRAKKIEGNPDFPNTLGKHRAVTETEIQTLYHPDRISGPLYRKTSSGNHRPYHGKRLN